MAGLQRDTPAHVDWSTAPAPLAASWRSVWVHALELERGRFFLWAPVCLALGIAAYFNLPREPSMFAALAPLMAALLLRVVVARGTLVSAAITAVILAASGFALAKLRVESVAAPVLQKPMRNVVVEGVVLRAEARTPRGQRLTLQAITVGTLDAGTRPAVVRIRTLTSKQSARPGEHVRLTATLSPPARPALPGGFDFARTAWFAQLGAVGYAYGDITITPRAADLSALNAARVWIEDLRQAIGARILAALPGQPGAIAVALTTGERGAISTETNSAFKNSGLFHILSISGLHMVIMAGAVFYAVRLLLAAFPAVALTYPIKKIAAGAGIAGALAYLAISGAEFATVRSALMILIIFGAVLLDRPALALRNVALAAFAILAVYPESLLDAGFQMSFAAVTGLIASYEEIRRRFERRSEPHPVLRVFMFFGGIVTSTLIASAAVAPFAAYHFHQSQQYAVLANLIAIPICNFVVMPAELAALILMPFGLEGLALWPMGKGIEAMMWCANAVAAIPGAVGHLPEISTMAFLFIAGGGLWLALWQSRMRLLGGLGILAGLLLAPLLPRPDVLIARNGALVAVRDASGLLSALPAPQSKFELGRWLEHDGDGRSVAEAQTANGFACDGAGCVAQVRGATLAVSRHAAALPDDCARADIVIVAAPKPAWCTLPGTVIDVFDVWRSGTHALYVESSDGPPQVRIETVAAHRGERPWGASPPPKHKILPQPVISGAGFSGADPGAEADGDGASGARTSATPGAERSGQPRTAPASPRAEVEEDDESETAGSDPGEEPSSGE